MRTAQHRTQLNRWGVFRAVRLQGLLYCIGAYSSVNGAAIMISTYETTIWTRRTPREPRPSWSCRRGTESPSLVHGLVGAAVGGLAVPSNCVVCYIVAISKRESCSKATRRPRLWRDWASGELRACPRTINPLPVAYTYDTALDAVATSLAPQLLRAKSLFKGDSRQESFGNGESS